jgi:hypothetical protein
MICTNLNAINNARTKNMKEPIKRPNSVAPNNLVIKNRIRGILGPRVVSQFEKGIVPLKILRYE